MSSPRPQNTTGRYAVNAVSSVLTALISMTALVWVNQYLLRRISPEEYALVPVVTALMVFAEFFRIIFTRGLSRAGDKLPISHPSRRNWLFRGCSKLLCRVSFTCPTPLTECRPPALASWRHGPLREALDPIEVFRPLVVIPCLNEARHIERVARQMQDAVRGTGGRVVIVDGGSEDGTAAIAERLSRSTEDIAFLHNPARLQGPGINAAVRLFGDGCSHLVRVDAHAAYPDDFVEILGQEAAATGAASTVVGMIAEGDGFLQRLSAAAQNDRIGNGGARHRRRGTGRFVDHGHHALMRLDAFRAVGGYDESFSHNEDAELDFRLVRAGYRIWLTSRTQVIYYPRTTLHSLARQYFNYGKGRAKNLMKHGAWPRARQIAVIAVGPATLLAGLAPATSVLAVPALLWMGTALLGGVVLALGRRDLSLALSGPVAMLMHLSWSLGFWVQVIAAPSRPRQEAPV